jgi:hypothetical protein
MILLSLGFKPGLYFYAEIKKIFFDPNIIKAFT